MAPDQKIKDSVGRLHAPGTTVVKFFGNPFHNTYFMQNHENVNLTAVLEEQLEDNKSL